MSSGARVAGIEHASFASTVAFGDVQMGGRVGRQQTRGCLSHSTSPDYFETLGLRVLRGRGFTPAEEQHERSRVPDRRAWRHSWSAKPIRSAARCRCASAPPIRRAAASSASPRAGARPVRVAAESAIYVAYGSRFNTMMTLHARTAPGASDTAALGVIRRELQALDPRMAILWARTMTLQRDASISAWSVRAAAGLFSAFGVLALVLATIGVYGLKAYDVSRRTREIGIRMALGATSGDVERPVMREGTRSTVIGLAIGLLLAAGIGRLLSGLLYRVSPFDPVVMTIAAVVLSTAAMLACYFPARRATRIVPLEALRSE
jgi:hypothetical protein